VCCVQCRVRLHSLCTAHNTHTALRHATTSPNLYNNVILPSILTNITLVRYRYSSLMVVIKDRNMQERYYCVFNVNLKLLAKLTNSAFVGE